MANIRQAREAVITRILEGDGQAPRAERRAAFDNAVHGALQPLVQKVATHAYKVTDEDVASARASGKSEDQVFELVVCAAVGEASRQYDSGLAALEAAARENGHAPGDSR